MTMEIKKKIIFILVAFTAILIILNALLGNRKHGIAKIKTVNFFLTRNKIEDNFKKILATYGIQNQWINKTNIKSKQYDSLKFKYIIEVPSSVPIPLIIKDISLILNNKNINVISRQKEFNSSTELIVKANNFVKLYANFKYNNSLHRPSSTAAFIIKNINTLSADELSAFLMIPQKYGVLLPLRNSSIGIAEKILDAKRNYYISLDDDADNVFFELDEDFGVHQLKKNIKSIISSFNTPHYYFVNKKTTGFSNSFINFLIDEFKKRKRKILRENSFINLKGEDSEDLKSLLNFHLNNIKPGNFKIFFIDVNDWENVQQVLNDYLKKGNKIILPSKLLIRKKK